MAKFYTDRKPLSFNLTYDVPFKFMFAQQGETESLLARFLNYILALKGEQEIIKLEYQNVEIPPISMEGRRLILDLKVTDQGVKLTTLSFSVKIGLQSLVGPCFSIAESLVSNLKRTKVLIA